LTREPGADGEPALEALLLLLAEPGAPVSASSVRRAREVHLADSLSGLELESLRAAEKIADLGSGAGLPGLVLAARLPEARIDLIESVSRKCEFLRRAVQRMGLGNVEVVCERSEAWAGGAGREAYDAVTARAVGSLATLAEPGRAPAPRRRRSGWSEPSPGWRWSRPR
jgi:16S rRNA (guanine527-N7)-methyltransferase